jgi:hypothetical protein
VAYNPSSVRIQRMLGASRPIQPPKLPKPMATPKLKSSINDRMLMRPMADGGGLSPNIPPVPGISDPPGIPPIKVPRLPPLGSGSGRAFGGGLPLNRPTRASGGAINDSPDSPFTGGILSSGAGRADDVPMHVPDGAYVVPAWAVSHMGEGNTINGMSQLKMMFGSPWGAPKTPFGAPSPPLKVGKGVGIPRPPPAHFQPPLFGPPGYTAQNPALADGKQKHGGAAHAPGPGGAVPINASGGEFVIEPDEVARIGDGNVDKGHLVLDKWVVQLKKEAAQTLKQLPGPAK